MNASHAIANGTYFLHPDGGAWVAARVRSGEVITTTEESLADTHDAARDRWAGVRPSAEDREVDRDTARAVVLAVMGEDADPGMVVVTREA